MGKRLNTREIRKRQELESLRHEKIQALLKINPYYKPPADYRYAVAFIVGECERGLQTADDQVA